MSQLALFMKSDCLSFVIEQKPEISQAVIKFQIMLSNKRFPLDKLDSGLSHLLHHLRLQPKPEHPYQSRLERPFIIDMCK